MIIKQKEESHAYMLGVDAFVAGNEKFAPIHFSATVQREWLDGYEDAEFLYNAEREEQ